MPVVVVTGARQTGKTTLVQSLAAKRTYVSLDDLGILDQAQREPEGLLQSPPVSLDEVQRAPDLVLAIKMAVDRHRQAGDFLLTGSANLLLMERVADSLAGRAIHLDLPPFCPAEWQGRPDALSPIDHLFDPTFDLDAWPVKAGEWATWLVRGGYPPALRIDRDEDRSLWFAAYTQTYLERDLRQLSDVSSLPDFQRLMGLAAQRTGRLLNQAELARDAALSHATAHRYLNLLETGCLITRIRPYTSNPAIGLVKSPRLFWNDCGLAAFLAGIHRPDDVRERPDRGFWLEQTLFQTLQTWRTLDPLRRRLYFWRNRSGQEVDFILEQEGRLVALEIKAGERVTLDDAKGIRALRNSHPDLQHLRGVILHAGTPRALDHQTFALPWTWMTPQPSPPPRA